MTQTQTQTHTHWKSNGVMCCNYTALASTRLNNYNELIQRTVMVNFIACPKITKITKLKSLFNHGGNGPFTTKVFWVDGKNPILN